MFKQWFLVNGELTINFFEN
jgi:hypothetical protein